MPVTPTYPGVYVQEVPSGVRTIAGVSTSVGMFIGASKKGPMFSPIRCVNYSAFRDKFGEDSSAGSLAHYVKLFFLNGGTDCYVMRIAQGASASTVTLQNEPTPAVPAGANTLSLTAKDLGVAGEGIRALVTYNGSQPEVTFNLELFRWEVDSTGTRSKKAGETWRNLSMDPNSPSYAPTFITQNSKLVDAADLNAAPAANSTWGFSLSGRAVSDAGAAGDFLAAWGALLGSTVTSNRFKISLSGSPYIDVDLRSIVVDDTPANLTAAITTAIQTAFTNAGFAGVTVGVTLVGTAANGRRLRITRTSGTNGDVFIRPGTTFNGHGDLAVSLMLGTEQGGLEVGAFAGRRPAPTGITFSAFTQAHVTALGDVDQQDLDTITLDAINDATGTAVATPIDLQGGPLHVRTAGATDPVFRDGNVGSANGNSDGIREKLAIIAQLINEFTPPAGQSWYWEAETYGYRLAILPTDSLEDNFVNSTAVPLTTTPVQAATAFTRNVHYYSVGADGQSIGGLQVSAGAAASDGTPPLAADYDAAYEIIDREVDIFNLMILAPVADEVVTVQSLYGNASIFCQSRRAFLIMDPPAAWADAQTASTGIAALRVGLVKDYSALFFPRVTINDAGLAKNIGGAGAMAGLFARTDGTRGVWKAPAGTEADLRGIIGLEQRFSDGENGILNPKAVNTLRIFPNGIVSWGARTMDGDDSFGSEYKYIPIRRLALYMEESLYRGLKWAVFEPNDEPLHSQIRLNVGAFMHNLFRQGAFQGRTPKEAYFVKCDSETTTQNDRNLGIVNVWVGFAPLKPAEFVILYLQQMAGQIET
ncbi:MAG TPA: phage tail sheath C-terminal domain-containing protein [Opitutaceae bacterium]|nr:phage tail sheath C-terminal domain-containing protein [Opitutaceae bacterium]